ncbi:MAG: hypothetical protein ABIV47_14675, partial [Roseiflexaceae bacterium]
KTETQKKTKRRSAEGWIADYVRRDINVLSCRILCNESATRGTTCYQQSFCVRWIMVNTVVVNHTLHCATHRAEARGWQYEAQRPEGTWWAGTVQHQSDHYRLW